MNKATIDFVLSIILCIILLLFLLGVNDSNFKDLFATINKAASAFLGR